MKKVLVFGTFDGLHEGHVDFFRQAKEFGDFLIVVVGRDSTVQRTKKRPPKFNEMERLVAVKNSKFVNEAQLGNEAGLDGKLDPFKVIEEVRPDIICLGYDQTHFTEKLLQELPKRGLGHVKVERLKPYKPEIYHSSLLNT